jgi:hypothetical protein
MTPPTPKELTPEMWALVRDYVDRNTGPDWDASAIVNETPGGAVRVRVSHLLAAYDALKAERDAIQLHANEVIADRNATIAELSAERDAAVQRLAAAEQKNTRVLDIARRLAVRSGFAAEALKELDAALTTGVPDAA